jgi:hypothetical protein
MGEYARPDFVPYAVESLPLHRNKHDTAGRRRPSMRNDPRVWTSNHPSRSADDDSRTIVVGCLAPPHQAYLPSDDHGKFTYRSRVS